MECCGWNKLEKEDFLLQYSVFTIGALMLSCASDTHQGMAFSSQRTNVPPRVLSLSLELQGLFQGLMLGRLFGLCLSETAAASSGKHIRANSTMNGTVSSEKGCQLSQSKNLLTIFWWQDCGKYKCDYFNWMNEIIPELRVRVYSWTWKQEPDRSGIWGPMLTLLAARQFRYLIYCPILQKWNIGWMWL